MKVVSRAPGKVLLFGEYVVLEGAPALVAALDAYAEVSFASHPAAGQGGGAANHDTWQIEARQLGLRASFVRAGGAVVPTAPLPAALQLVADVLGDAVTRGPLPPGTLSVDTQAFYRGPHKLGLGSSAAVAVATWHALEAASVAAASEVGAARRKTAAPDALAEIMALHQRAQHGVGSGVDVAASSLGGVVRYQLPNLPGSQGAAGRLASPVAALETACLVPVYTGRGVSTAPYLQAFAQLKSDDAATYWACLEPLAQLSAAACELWALGQTQGLLPLVDAYAAALQRLGEAMGMPVVSAEHRAIAEVVRHEGAAYKPSGAGGGDVGLAFCADARAAKKLVRQLRRHNFVPLSHRIAVGGITTASPPTKPRAKAFGKPRMP